MIAILLLLLAGAPPASSDFAELELELEQLTLQPPRLPDAANRLRRDPAHWIAVLEAHRLEQLPGAQHPTDFPRWSFVARALARQLGSPMVPYLTGLLHGPDARLRSEAATLLGLTGAAEAEAPLWAALRDEALGISEYTAAASLGLVLDPAAYPKMVQDLKREDALYRGLRGRRGSLTVLAWSVRPEALAALLELLAARVQPQPILGALAQRRDLPEDLPQRLRSAWKPADLVEAGGGGAAAEVLLRGHPTEAGVAYLVEVFRAGTPRDRTVILNRARAAGEVAAPILELAAQDRDLAPAVAADLSPTHPAALLAALPTLDRDHSPKGRYAAAQAAANATRAEQAPRDLAARLKDANALNRLVLVLGMADHPTPELAPLLEEWSRTGEPWVRAFALEGLARVAPQRVARVKLTTDGPLGPLVAVARAEAAAAQSAGTALLTVETRGPTHFGIDTASGPEGTLSKIEVLSGGLARLSAVRQDTVVIPLESSEVEAFRALLPTESNDAPPGGRHGWRSAKVIVTKGFESPLTVTLPSEHPALQRLAELQIRARLSAGLSGGDGEIHPTSARRGGRDPETLPPAILRWVAGAGHRDMDARGRAGSPGDGFTLLAGRGDTAMNVLLVEALEVDCHRPAQAFDAMSLEALEAAKSAAAPCEAEVQTNTPWLQALIRKGPRAATAVLDALQERAKLGQRLSGWPGDDRNPAAVRAVDSLMAAWVVAQPDMSDTWMEAALVSILRHPAPNASALLAKVEKDPLGAKGLLVAARASAGESAARASVQANPRTYLRWIPQMPPVERERFMPLALDVVTALAQGGQCPSSMLWDMEGMLETVDPPSAKRLVDGLGPCFDHLPPQTRSYLQSVASGHPFSWADGPDQPKDESQRRMVASWWSLARKFPDDAIAYAAKLRAAGGREEEFEAVDLMLAADAKRAVNLVGADIEKLPVEWRVRLVRAARDTGQARAPLVVAALSDPSLWVRREASDMHL